MDKITNLKMDEIRKLVNDEQYKKALDILNSMDISKVKTMKDLSLFAFIYEQNRQYIDAKNLLLQIYHKNKTRRVIFYLINIFIKMKYVDEAEKFFEEYLIIAPGDIDQYILRYKIDKAENKPYDILIKDLQNLKSQDYMEEWLFELAKLYHKAGYEEKCIKECNDIILWFGEGVIVEKASLLKEYYLGNNEKINAICDKIKEINIKEEEKRENVEVELQDKPNSSNNTTSEEQLVTQNNNIQVTEENEINNIQETEENEINISEEIEKNKKDFIEIEDRISENTIVEDENIIKNLGRFIKIHDIKNQISSVLNCDFQSNKHMIITGLVGCGKTNLAKRLLTVFFKMGYINTAKIAKIKSDKLNKINLDEKYDKLIGGALIVEKAGLLTHISIEQLIRLMNNFKEEIVIILEDEKENMEQLLLDNPALLNLIQKRIDIPEYNSEELMDLVNEYLLKEEYVLEEDAIIKLQEIINYLMTEMKPEERLGSLLQVIKEVKESVERRNMKNLSKIVEKGEYKNLDFFKIRAIDIIFNK